MTTAAWIFGIPGIFTAALILALVLILVRRSRFHRNTRREVHTLLTGARDTVGPDQLRARLPDLPPPVQRYLRHAIREGAPAIRSAHLQHDGYFRTAPGQKWLPIRGTQTFSVAQPGFVWTGVVRVAPLVSIEARDCLLEGRGNMRVRLLSAFTIADSSGPAIDQGARLRWIAECAWFPYAVVGDAIAWDPVDDDSARVRLLCDGIPVHAVVRVDRDGKLTHLEAQRHRDVGGGRTELTRWRGEYADYRDFHGFRVPASVEVIWELGDTSFSYARFRIVDLYYNAAPAS